MEFWQCSSMAPKIIYTVCLPRPVSVNAAYSTRKTGAAPAAAANKKPKFGRVKSKAYVDWMAHAKKALLAQRRPDKPISCPVEMVLNLPATKARADAANFEKVASDFLVKAGVLLDDFLIRRNTQQWVNGLPYAIIEFYEYDGPTVSEYVLAHIKKPWEGLA